MKYNYLKYSALLVGIILISIMTSCTKGDEPVPMSNTVSVDAEDVSMMREGDLTGGGDGDGDVSIVGGDNNEDDDDDTIIGGDDNEDDDVDVVGGDVIIGGGLTGGSSDGGKGGN
ncbi:MAG: hypothetical protein P1U41_00140 [Vicingaceae bacterium]|nr:hypothetical protein [Vicingaceae bacterium]